MTALKPDGPAGAVALLASQAARPDDRLPCLREDLQLWFSERPADLELAKAYCRPCPLRGPCLAGAVERHEPHGVWGGEIFDRGAISAAKRPRGRPPRRNLCTPLSRKRSSPCTSGKCSRSGFRPFPPWPAGVASPSWTRRWAGVGMAEAPDPRDESEAERIDRNLAELLQELRVAGLGVQVLFGFLLSLPFTSRFTQLSHGQRELYLATLMLAAVATALLLGPVAYHRLVFRRGQKEGLVRAASAMAIAGLATVGLAVSAAVLLVTGYVVSALPAALITAFVAGVFGLLWFAFPLARRR